MINKNKSSLSEPTDHETFRQTIAQLDQSLVRGWKSAGTQITLALGAIATPYLLASKIRNHLVIALAVNVLLLLMLACNAYGLAQLNELKHVRDRLNRQLDISIKQRIRAEKLYGLSILDPLTGLHNRRFAEERLQEEMARAERNGEPLAVLLLDLDHFKEINDQHGHAAGDAALKEFSRRLRKAIRACDVPVRLGGDEFLVILPECPREKVDNILSRLGSPEVEIDLQKFPVRYSVGRSHYQVKDTINTLLRRADEVLYSEKQKRADRSKIIPAPSQWSDTATLN
jgi:diguanylate cyclase (GGDEF)-like protein